MTVSIIYDRRGGNTIFHVFEDELEAVRRFRVLQGNPKHMLCLTTTEVTKGSRPASYDDGGYRREEDFRRGDPGHPKNEMGM